MIKVVFVCLGNICRSPMAEAVFKKMVYEEYLQNEITVDSAATSSWEQGNPVHHGTVKQLAKVGITTEGMYSRQLNEKDLDADYIIAMDESNLKNIKKFSEARTHAEIKMLLSYAEIDRGIADPWYTGDFSTTYQDVVVGCQGLLAQIRKRYNI